MEWPKLAELARDAFPEDAIARAKELQSEIGSIGAYSHSQGVPFIRKNVARFIEGQFCRHPCLYFLPPPPNSPLSPNPRPELISPPLTQNETAIPRTQTTSS